MTRVLLDPTSGDGSVARPAAARLSTLEGATVGLLDISKPRGGVFLDRVADLVARPRRGGASLPQGQLPRMAPADLRAEIASQCDAVIEALAD